MAQLANTLAVAALILKIFLIGAVATTFEASEAGNSSTALLRVKRSNKCVKDITPRHDCGWPGITSEICQQLDCCWNARDGQPFCFIGHSGTYTRSDSCKPNQPMWRIQCGNSGISKSQCESLNCCYDNRLSDAPNCFQSNGGESRQWSTGLEKSDVERLIEAEKNTLDILSRLKTRILKAHTDYSISKTVGSSVGIAGGVATIAGIALAPFTFGWSLGLTIGGVVGTVAGASTTLTTSIIQTIKEEGWADELEKALDTRAEELWRIGNKIESSPGWYAYSVLTGKAAVFSAFKIPSLFLLKSIIKYTLIMKADYAQVSGITVRYGQIPGWMIREMKLPENMARPITAGSGSSPTFVAGRNAQAAYWGQQRMPMFLKNEKHWLTKSFRAMGINTTKIGMKAISSLCVVLTGVGIGLDIYTIVDTWTTTPESAKQIDAIINHLSGIYPQLEELKRDMN